MGRLVVHQELINNVEELVNICPFRAIEYKNDRIEISSACKMCRICVNKGKKGAIEYVEEEIIEIDKSLWNGIMVFVEYSENKIHPVTFELIGKARELAYKINHPVYCIFPGYGIKKKAEELLQYGVDKVFIYHDEELKYFRIEPYTSVFEECIKQDGFRC